MRPAAKRDWWLWLFFTQWFALWTLPIKHNQANILLICLALPPSTASIRMHFNMILPGDDDILSPISASSEKQTTKPTVKSLTSGVSAERFYWWNQAFHASSFISIVLKHTYNFLQVGHWVEFQISNARCSLTVSELKTVCGRDDRLLEGMLKQEWFISSLCKEN